MPNMSYCRFQNTLSDLEDCIDSLDEGDWELSEEEMQAAKDLFEACDHFRATWEVNRDHITVEGDEEEAA